MRLSFDDDESFKEAAGSLRFNNSPSDSNSLQQEGSSSNTASDPNIILQVRRVPVGSSSSTPPQEGSEDT